MNTPRNDFEEDWDEQPAPGSASLNPTTPGYQAETPIDGAGGGGGSVGGSVGCCCSWCWCWWLCWWLMLVLVSVVV